MPDTLWILRNNETSGPFSAGQLRQMAAAGMIVAADMISADQIDWQVAGQVKGLFHTEELAAGGGTDNLRSSVSTGNEQQPLPLLLVQEPSTRTRPHGRGARHQSPKSEGVICGVLILATLVLPWPIGPEGKTIMGWELLRHEDIATVPLLALGVVALATVIASVLSRGLTLLAIHAILGLLGASALTVFLADAVAHDPRGFILLYPVLLATLVISTRQKLRIGGGMVMLIFQVVAGTLFLVLWVAIGQDHMDRLSDPELDPDLFGIAILLGATHVACLVGVGLMLMRSRHQGRSEKLSRLGLGIVFASIASLVPYYTIGKFGLVAVMMFVHLVLPVVYLACTGVLGFLCGLLHLRNGSAKEGKDGIGGAFGRQERNVYAAAPGIKRPEGITILATLNVLCGTLALLVTPFIYVPGYVGHMSALCALLISGLAYLAGDRWAGYGAGLIYVILSVGTFTLEACPVLSAKLGGAPASVPGNLGISALILLPYPFIYLLVTNSRESRRYFSTW